MPRAAWGLAVFLAASAAARPAAAQPLAPTGGPPAPQSPLAFDPNPPGQFGQLPPEPTTPAAATTTTKPPPVLGAPVLGAPVRPADRDPPAGGVTTASYPDSPSWDEQPRRAVGLGAPAAAGNPLPARVVEPAAR